MIDGLDEDEAGATPTRGRPSIASSLPGVPLPVSDSLHQPTRPGLPDDLLSDHPLRACKPHRLSVSPVAEDIELLAKQELRHLLAGHQIAIDMVGTSPGRGGLTRSDLSALTGAARIGSTLSCAACSGAPSTYEPPQIREARRRSVMRVYLSRTRPCGHGRGTSRRRPACYRKVHEWIGSYADADWPVPLRASPSAVTCTCWRPQPTLTRLSALARAPRQARILLDALLEATDAALTHIGTAESLIADRESSVPSSCSTRALPFVDLNP